MSGIKYIFKLRGHWWFDAGVAGLQNIASNLVEFDEERWREIELEISPDALVISAPDESFLDSFIDACYEYLVTKWWNVSSPAQEEKRELVIYDRKKKNFDLASKCKATPVAYLSITGGSCYRPKDGIKYAELSDDMKERTTSYLRESRRKLWGTKKILLFSPPVCHPEIKVKAKNICSICGKEAKCAPVTQRFFPLFSSDNATFSFNSMLGRSDVLCRECALLGTFAVHSALYKRTNLEFKNNKKGKSILSVMQIYSNNLEALIDVHDIMGNSSNIRIFEKDKLAFRNFGTDDSLVTFAKLPYEVLWSFFLLSFDELNRRRKNAYDIEKQIKGIDSLNDEELYWLASTGVIIISFEKSDKSFLTKEIFDFHDAVYLFRLIDYVGEEAKDEKILYSKGINSFWKELFRDFELVKDQKKQFDPANGILRNKILKKIFEKSSILQDVEAFVFKKAVSEEYPNISRILFFVIRYERVINGRDVNYEGGKGMTKEQVDVAKGLGAQIVIGGKQSLLGDSKDINKIKPLKGDLFSLRKTRTATGFLEQLNRLQFRYGLVINRQIVEGILEEIPFEDFKSYCMISALNSYNNEFRPSKSAMGNETYTADK